MTAKKEFKSNDIQIGGSHYHTDSDFQHWDFAVQALRNRYFESNITKYVFRHKKKNGLQDLEKAFHYLDKLESLFTQGLVYPMYLFHETIPVPLLAKIEKDAKLDYAQTAIAFGLMSWKTVADLDGVRTMLRKIATPYYDLGETTLAVKTTPVESLSLPFEGDATPAYVDQDK